MEKANYQLGTTYNRLTILEVFPWTKAGGTKLKCQCSCGTIKLIRARDVISGAIKSCGCLNTEGKGRPLVHGQASFGCTKEYNVWREIKDRCLNPNNKKYTDYGGRGITVHSQWINDFQAFFTHIGPAPSKSHSIERIENDKGYIPGNIKWATMYEQSRNKRNNRWFEIEGKKLILNDWAKLLGVCRENLRDMIKRNSFEYAYKHYTDKNKGLRP